MTYNYEVDVLINGKPVKQYLHEGKNYIEAKKGSKFELRIQNNTAEEVLAVPSVDGLSVMDGKLCSIHESRGYIIKPYNAVTIDGWRKSEKEVAEFFFSEPSKSYAELSEHGSLENVGVIGVAIFRKKWEATTNTINWVYNNTAGVNLSSGGAGGTIGSGGGGGRGGVMMALQEANSLKADYTSVSNYTAKSGSANLVFASQKVSQDVGTGWGSTVKSEIQRKYFGRRDTPEAIYSIFYNTRKQLEAMGVNLNREAVYVTPEPFPGDYCKPPKN